MRSGLPVTVMLRASLRRAALQDRALARADERAPGYGGLRSRLDCCEDLMEALARRYGRSQYRPVRDTRLLLPGLASLLGVGVTVSVLVVVNPWNYARLDRSTAGLVTAAIVVGLGVLVIALLLRRKGSPWSGGFTATGLAVAAVLGLFCAPCVHGYAPTWKVLMQSPDGRYALAERTDGFELGPDGPRSLHLWVGTGLLARDMGQLLVYSWDYHDVSLTEYRFVDDHTIRAAVGDEQYTFTIDDHDRPSRRTP
ncbi:hypothetical protein [Dactylosporangium sp. NPDC050588]|uniref:hypothetical protein n=1 Tax=Dactylosporangium sp. NPDC050588 TaxID=3157211 RepID=UPI0033DC1969